LSRKQLALSASVVDRARSRRFERQNLRHYSTTQGLARFRRTIHQRDDENVVAVIEIHRAIQKSHRENPFSDTATNDFPAEGRRSRDSSRLLRHLARPLAHRLHHRPATCAFVFARMLWAAMN
jgi:hypothetical protein